MKHLKGVFKGFQIFVTLIMVVTSFGTTMLWIKGSLTSLAYTGNPLASAQGFNLMTSGDFTSTKGDIDGAVAVGNNLFLDGDMVLAAQSAGNFVVPGNLVPSGLYVGNGVVYNSGTNPTYVNNGRVHIGNSTGTLISDVDQNNASMNLRLTSAGNPLGIDSLPRVQSQSFQPKITVVPVGTPLDFASSYNNFNNDGAALKACSNTIIPSSVSGSGPVVDIQPNKTNVWNITSANLDTWGEIAFTSQPTASNPLVINVQTPATWNWSKNVNFPALQSSSAQYIIWNFPDLQTWNINNSSSLIGSVLAPKADIVRSDIVNNIEGQVVAKSFVNKAGELHNFPFAVNINCEEIAPKIKIHSNC
jgi:choice-of-anchor A domain-containing protein